MTHHDDSDVVKIHPIRSSDTNPATGRPYYMDCDRCNYQTHICPACGDDLTHNEMSWNHKTDQWESHTVKECRPDLFEHEPGDLCSNDSWCYWDHDNNKMCENGNIWEPNKDTDASVV